MIRSPVRGLVRSVVSSGVNFGRASNDAFERINNGEFDSGDVSMWVRPSGGWSFGFDTATVTTSGEMYQVLGTPLVDGDAFVLRFDINSGAQTLQVALYQDATPVQTIFEQSMTPARSVEVYGYVTGAANRIRLALTDAIGSPNDLDNLSLIA